MRLIQISIAAGSAHVEAPYDPYEDCRRRKEDEVRVEQDTLLIVPIVSMRVLRDGSRTILLNPECIPSFSTDRRKIKSMSLVENEAGIRLSCSVDDKRGEVSVIYDVEKVTLIYDFPDTGECEW